MRGPSGMPSTLTWDQVRNAAPFRDAINRFGPSGTLSTVRFIRTRALVVQELVIRLRDSRLVRVGPPSSIASRDWRQCRWFHCIQVHEEPHHCAGTFRDAINRFDSFAQEHLLPMELVPFVTLNS
ncbi:hypothetical protein BCR34DRAFT_52463 [Clohesyomyces aquaticus]|uniref:Uncharacterized protein n=1 Tax=Clohesyomyces aquaticus TaxID=1231657 RepID=A0A1Y2A4R9_9PLEO|nr:hypothetical protein BCR34DRAFT_52463 [Clohesyomyces aquaticus]